MIAAIEILRATSRNPPPPSGGPHSNEGAPIAVRSLKVLIVEDESVIAWALESLLEDLGHDVVGIASSGAAAIAAAAEHGPDLVLMDIHLGQGPDGVEVAGQIVSNGSVNVIFVSAYGDAGTRARIAERVPGAPLVSKPASARSIQAAITAAFERRQ